MMQLPKLVWGDGGASADWLLAASVIALLLLALLVAGYWRIGATRGVRLLAAGLKLLGILILLFCLLDPLFSEQRARPGANQFVVLADNSESMTLKDAQQSKSRGDELKEMTKATTPWVTRLGKDFDLRQFAFDTQLRTVEGLDTLTFDGRSSDLGAALDHLVRRFEGRPLAGVLLFTDGSATDPDAIERVLARMNASPESRIPIYPVLMGKRSPIVDINVNRIAVTQTNFEDAPVTLAADVTATGEVGKTIVVELLDEAGKSIERQKLTVQKDGEPIAARFKLKPEQAGVSFYKVRAASEAHLEQFDQPDKSNEATLANNSRIAVVDRGHGPYRVLYVSGRPNWEFKFLQRAVQSDDQVQLIGLMRLARREPKFDFATKTVDSANPLFRGFKNRDEEQVEQYDQPVLMRVGIADESELRGGFPQKAEDLFKYHAVILDDVESGFFTQDQLLLLKEFVRQRGGGLLMLGGEETFKNGNYDKTPLGDVLPVYADQVPDYPVDAKYRLALTREGWLEPWLRVRSEEDAERQRFEAMPPFQSLNPIRGIKPGATVLARVTPLTASAGSDASIDGIPALVEQRFGQGRVGAMLIGDLWRWEMHRPEAAQSDYEKAWRQTVRWLVGDVPKRVEVAIDSRREADDANGTLRVVSQVRDPAYLPLDNATVTMKITPPDGKPVEIRAQPSERLPGRYEATYVPRQPGAYRVEVSAAAPDGSDAGQAQAGWTSDPAAEEFRDLQPDNALLQRIASSTGGEVVKAADLDPFVATLPSRHAKITEPFIRPFWHQSWIFLLAIACLAAEWGLRRWKGLP
jgi:uncharacterized membrane protein